MPNRACAQPAATTEIDFEKITAYQRYKMMASLIVPRPIALVTTIDSNGIVNAAPFSMFNMVGEDPPIVMISINRHADEHLKDTARNILAHGEFVVHMTDEAMVEQMHACGAPFPADISEIAQVGLHTRASHCVAPPQIVEAPVAFECVLHETLQTASRYVFIGRVKWLTVKAGLVDTTTWRTNLKEYHPVGRFGASYYVSTRARFSVGTSVAQNSSASIDEI